MTGSVVSRALVAVMQGLTERDWLVYRVNSADKFRMYISSRAAEALIDVVILDMDADRVTTATASELLDDRSLQHMQTCLLNQLAVKMAEVKE